MYSVMIYVCVAVITSPENDFHLISTTSTITRAETTQLFFGCLLIIHSLSFERCLMRRRCNVSSSLFHCTYPLFRRNRNFGSNVLSSTVWIFSLFIMLSSFCFFMMDNLCAHQETQKFTLNGFTFKKSLSSLK